MQRTGMQNVVDRARSGETGVQDRQGHIERSQTAKLAAKAANPKGARVVCASELVALVPLPESCSASVTSSLRTQPVLSVISLGQTTRLKFALCNVRYMAMRRWLYAYLGYEASCSQSNRHSQAGRNDSGRFWQSSFEVTPWPPSPKTD